MSDAENGTRLLRLPIQAGSLQVMLELLKISSPSSQTCSTPSERPMALSICWNTSRVYHLFPSIPDLMVFAVRTWSDVLPVPGAGLKVASTRRSAPARWTTVLPDASPPLVVYFA